MPKYLALNIIIAIYLFSFFIVYFLLPLLSYKFDMVNVLVADVVATIIVFIFSFIFNNSSVYDPYWSVTPPVIVIYLMNSNPYANQVRQYIIFALVVFWSIRLTLNWARGWSGFEHQDWRYTSIAEKTGKFYWPVSFLGIHFMPTLFVFLGCLPLWFSLSSITPLNVIDFLAAFFTLAAILTEWIADEQLIKFKKSISGNSYIQSGLWAYSRHPNYLGEISFWIGMFLFAVSSFGLEYFAEYWWTSIGFISMIILFNFISIPLMEKRNLERKPGYENYIKNIPSLIPHPFKMK